MITDVLDEYRQLTQRSSPRPATWEGIVGNARAVAIIREAITAAQRQQRPLPHTLLFGPPGMGKTTLSKLIARDLGTECVETTASTLETPQDMIQILWQLNEIRERTGQPAVLFLDEIHQLGVSKGRQAIDAESIYPLLEDWFFPHNLMGRKIADVTGQEYVLTTNKLLVWPMTCVGATTEPGWLSAPILRRFLLQVELDPYSEAEIAVILRGSADRLGWPITDEAAQELAKYARRNPGRALSLVTVARNRAVASDREVITFEVASEVIDRMRLYPQGLTETDVRILRILADRPKGVGQAELCRAVGISLSQFNMQEPYLRLLDFIQTLARRVITPKGLAYLAQLGQIDASRPEVRAVLSQTT